MSHWLQKPLSLSNHKWQRIPSICRHVLHIAHENNNYPPSPLPPPNSLPNHHPPKKLANGLFLFQIDKIIHLSHENAFLSQTHCWARWYKCPQFYNVTTWLLWPWSWLWPRHSKLSMDVFKRYSLNSDTSKAKKTRTR